MADYSGGPSYAEMIAKKKAQSGVGARVESAMEKVVKVRWSVRRPFDGYEIDLGGGNEGSTARIVALALKDLTGDRWSVRMVKEIEEEYYP